MTVGVAVALLVLALPWGSIPTVIGDHIQCTGVVVAPTVVATASHCAHEVGQYRVMQFPVRWVGGVVWATNWRPNCTNLRSDPPPCMTADIALIVVTKPPMLPVRLRKSDPMIGERVRIPSHMMHCAACMTSGVVVRYVTLNSGRVFATTAQVLDGASGSPVLDDEGMVIGLVSRHDTALTYAVPGSLVRDAMNASGLAR